MTRPRLHRLANGLTVAVAPMAGVETMALGLYIDVGGRNEADDRPGLAHMVEHMVFKGAGGRSARAIAEAIEDVGGALNAYTARDHTVFHARLMPGDTALFTVVYNRPVTVWGHPVLPLDIGYRRRLAAFDLQPTPDHLRFSYTLKPGDRDRNGISTGPALVPGAGGGIGLLWLGLVHGAAIYSPAPLILPRPHDHGPLAGAPETD